MAAQYPHVQTRDGSSTLYNAHVGDHYHSLHGALQESQHIFIQSGLMYYVESYSPASIDILEVGLGTGLNALLTALEMDTLPVRYTGLEPFPLDATTWRTLNYPQQLGQLSAEAIFTQIHSGPWSEYYSLTPRLSLRKEQCEIMNFQTSELFDVIYFDAFAPSAQPDMWTQDVFNKIFQLCRSKAVFITYSSKGAVRRGLTQAGFSVQKIPGPQGKREIIRAIRQ